MEQTSEAIAQQSGGKRLKKTGTGVAVAVAVTAAVLAGGYTGLCAYASGMDTIYPNQTMWNIPVGGLTVQEAARQLEQEFPKQTFDVEITSPQGTETKTLAYADFGAEPDYQKAAAAAYEETSGSFFGRGWRYLSATMNQSALTYPLEIDGQALQVGMDTLLSQLTYPPTDAFYQLQDTVLLVTTAKDGLEASTSFAADLRDCLENGGGSVKLTSVAAQSQSAQQIHDELAAEMKNAGYDRETGSITPEQVGAEFDVAAAQKQLDAAQPGETVRLDVNVEYPEVTADELQAVLFRDVLGEYTTSVGGTSARRGNVKLSAAAINGYVMNTGDVFSYNDVVGQRTTARGYKAAPAYVQGETVDEVGGGICQTSSTLYMACLLANVEITQRTAHRYVSSYIPLGMDATVSWGGPDYKFTNNTNYPIKIVTSYSGSNQLTIKILGTNLEGTYSKMTYEVLSTTPWETVYQDDNSLAPGTTSVKTTPYTGYKVKTYHTIYAKDGTQLDRHYEATSDYKSRNKVVLRGPAATTTETPSQSTTPSQPITPVAPVTPTEPITPPEPVTPPAETPDPGTTGIIVFDPLGEEPA